jgi:tripartite-type tricarboxylate transporter receptor subunit TctC
MTGPAPLKFIIQETNMITSLFRLGRRSLLAAAIAAVASQASMAAAATDYPQQPITIIVPFAPGGSLDSTARILAEKLKGKLGQPVLVLNRPGAGSAVGARAAATSRPDGYTLFLASGSAFGFLHLLVRNYDVGLKDFAPLAGVAVNSSVFAVNPSVPVKNLPELVAHAASKAGGMSICSTGQGGLNHLQLEMFKGLVKRKHPNVKFNVTHVPYNGVAPALTALRAGDVDACVLPYSGLIKNTDGAGIRVIAVQRGKRLAALPKVATTGEQGYAEMDGNDQLVTLSAPANTPQPVLQKLETAVQSIMAEPAVISSLNDIDVQPVFVKADDAQQWLQEDVKKLSPIIQESGLAIQP